MDVQYCVTFIVIVWKGKLKKKVINYNFFIIKISRYRVDIFIIYIN